MPQAFLTSTLSGPDAQATATLESTTDSGREKIIISIRGAAHGVERVVLELYRVGFAEVGEWSKPQPTGKPNEVIRILTRYVIAN